MDRRGGGQALTEVTKDLVQTWIPKRSRDSHKGNYGRVHILSGCVGYTGAPYFASEAAVRSGSGLVYLHVPQEIWSVLAVKCAETMVFPVNEASLPAKLSEADAVLIGPGLGRDPLRDSRTRKLAKELQKPLVLDADGINAVAGHIDVLKARRNLLTVLTPHEGEFSRLLGTDVRSLDRTVAAEHFARESGCVVVLKGHRTITAFPDGTLYRNTTGNPGMAKGGSGDVLSGIILSLLGQGISPEQAIPAAVWLHGRAGDLCAMRLGEYGMTPSDLLRAIPEAFRF